jgi:hypothetical protein
MDASSAHTTARPPAPAPGTPPLDRSLVLVGLMGAGKSSIGRRLARALRADFADADDEIAAAAGMDIPDIFAVYGEAVFRDLERRVVARLLDRPPHVLALGGGAFIDPDTRARVKASRPLRLAQGGPRHARGADRQEAGREAAARGAATRARC